MAEDAGELKVKITADLKDLKTGLDEAKTKLGGFSSASVALGTAFGVGIAEMGKAVLRFSIDAVKMFAESEQAVFRLSRAVGTDAANALAAYASELQKTTSFSDNSILALEGQLAAYGLLPGSVKTATKSILDYAAATGKDLPAAGMEFAQALTGQSRELKKYGLILAQGQDRTENMERVTAFLQKRFEGTAEAMKNTVGGSAANLTNRFEDMQKAIGKELVPVVKVLFDSLEFLGDSIKKTEVIVGDFLVSITGASKNELTVRQLAIDKMVEERKELMISLDYKKRTLFDDDQITKKMSERIVMLTRQINATKEQQKEEVKTTVVKKKEANLQTGIVGEQVNEETRMYQDMALTTKNLRAETEKAAREEVKTTTAKVSNYYHDQMKAARDSFEHNATFHQQMTLKLAQDAKAWATVWVGVLSSFTEKFSAGMAQLIVHGGSFRDAMKDIGQQILQEFIQQVIAKMVAAFMAALLQMKAAAAAANLGSGSGAGPGGIPLAGAGGAPGAGGMNGIGGGAAIIGAGTGAMWLSDQGEKRGGTAGGIIANPIGYQLNLAKKAFSSFGGAGETQNGNEIADEARGLLAMLVQARELRAAAKAGTITAQEYERQAQPILSFAGARVQGLSGRNSVWASAINPMWQMFQTEGFVSAKGGKWVMGDSGPTLWESGTDWKNGAAASTKAFALGGIIDEPTMLTGLRSGKRGIMGEAGPEAIVPMSGASRGGDIHIHINGNFIEADPSKWQRIIREQIIPQIRRYTMVNPIGPFTRLRGAA